MRTMLSAELAVAAIAAWTSMAMAADRVPMVGTAVSLVPPDGFAESTDGFGLSDGTARIRAFVMPGGYLFEDGVAADDTLAPFFGIEGYAETAAPALGEANGNVVYVQEGALAGEPLWVAVFNHTPNAALTFTGFDHDAMEAVLDTVVLAASEGRSDGAFIRGLWLPMSAPFTSAEVGGVVESATLSLTDEKGRDRSQPHIDLFFPTLMQYSGMDLAALATTLLELDTTNGSSTETTLLGVPALRQEGTGSRGSKGVGYVAVVAGQPIVLFGRGPEDQMTPEVIAAVDAAAAGLQRQSPE